MKKLFYRLSSSRLFAKLFSLLSFVALGLWFVASANAQWGGGFGAIDFGWSGQVHCDLVGESGGGAPSILNANPGSSTTPGSVTIFYPAVKCDFFNGTTPVNPPGTFAYKLTTVMPGVTSTVGDNDSNNGHGNTQPCDPGNPSGNRKCTPAPSGVICTNNTITGSSTRTWTAACGDAGVNQSGVVTWVGAPGENTPPSWTVQLGCTGNTPGTYVFDTNGNPIDVTGGSCVLDLGKFPLNKKGSVDLTACAAAFPANTLPERGVLSFMVNYESQMCQGAADPQDVFVRACHDHNFTPGFQNPPCAPESGIYHTGSGSSAPEILLADNQWQVNNTVNLKCVPGSVSGPVPTNVFNSSSFDTANISVALVGEHAQGTGTPVVTVDGSQDFSSPVNFAPLLDTSGNQVGVKLGYLSCRADGTGLAQVVCRHKDQWYKIDGTNAQVTLRISGTTTDDTPFTGVNFPVNLTATDQCQP